MPMTWPQIVSGHIVVVVVDVETAVGNTIIAIVAPTDGCCEAKRATETRTELVAENGR